VTVQSCTFGPLTVAFDERVLAPRRWTLLQSARAARHLGVVPPGAVVELHCGAGHIGQATAAWTDRVLVQVDDQPDCCAWAKENAAANDVAVAVVCADIESVPLADASCALVLADPPYVPSTETGRYPDDPRHAIDGGADGLDGLRACLPSASRLLRPDGMLVLQVRGPEQAARVLELTRGHHPELTVTEIVTLSATRALVDVMRR
jgi:methylase of polypeptide subunit release factors